jgi:AcrR family transcriptional regulator
VPRAVREPLILDVAGRAFAAAGYDHASMDRIAELAGVSKPMVYAYFGSKQGLYVAYIERTGRELMARLRAADSPHAPQAVRLRALVSEFLGFVEEHRDGWTVLFHELNAGRPIVSVVAHLREQIANEIGRMLAAGTRSRDGLDPPASAAVSHALVGAGESLANWWLAHPEVARSDVTEWFVSMAQAAIASAQHRGVGSTLLEQVLKPDDG